MSSPTPGVLGGASSPGFSGPLSCCISLSIRFSPHRCLCDASPRADSPRCSARRRTCCAPSLPVRRRSIGSCSGVSGCISAISLRSSAIRLQQHASLKIWPFFLGLGPSRVAAYDLRPTLPGKRGPLMAGWSTRWNSHIRRRSGLQRKFPFYNRLRDDSKTTRVAPAPQFQAVSAHVNTPHAFAVLTALRPALVASIPVRPESKAAPVMPNPECRRRPGHRQV